MAEKKEDDKFSLTTPAGAPAYPQVVYVQDGDKKYGNGEPVMKVVGTANNPDEHKELLKNNSVKSANQGQQANDPGWGDKK